MSKKTTKERNHRTVSRFKKVILVSAYGRGACLAHQLRLKGFKVSVYDVTALLPSVSSAEREGPFGVFLPSHLSDLEKQYLCGDNYYPVQKGFSLFTSQGPLELQGPLSNFFRKTRKNFQLCYSVLSHSDPNFFGFSKKKVLYNKLEQHSNLLRLSAELTNSHLEAFCNELSPIFSDYVFRESSKRYFEEVKSSLQKEGVKWVDIFPSQRNTYEENNIKDKNANTLKESIKTTESTQKSVQCFLEFRKKHIQLKLYEWEESSDFLVWTLNGLETKRFFPENFPVLFPRWEKPVKIWLRFPLSWDQGNFEKSIPSILLIMPDCKINSQSIFSSDTANQIICLKKTPSDPHNVDLWMLCPYDERFNQPVLAKLFNTALEKLNILFPNFSITGILPKMDSRNEYFVLYKKQNMFAKKKIPDRLLHLNPEQAGKMDAYSLLRHSATCLRWIQKRA